ncbi:helix-turn-helix domain-containing protein [Cobetia marina]
MRIILHNENQRPDVLVHVAANVRRLRLAAELSQQALADQAEISRRMLVNIEKGDVNVSLGTLDKLAEALGVLFYALVQPPESEDSARINEVAWVGKAPESPAVLLARSRPHRKSSYGAGLWPPVSVTTPPRMMPAGTRCWWSPRES